MTDVAIRAEGLSKRYRIGGARAGRTLRETLSAAARAPFRRGARALRETIWALKDVSFEIAPGEVVGVIGRNGAGKSTLLKILSRITEPTAGRAEVHGRVGSLLEVGTGFHNELTGRENIFLNGAILGMRKAEIARKFDEIVAFAEVERFIDTPVKHYSTGMYLRLAFAVAAHLEPEILLVDEVLAVGDAAFQKKCLGKMGDIAQQGRTVLFVSHNLSAILELCSRAVLVDGGRVSFDGSPGQAVGRYLERGEARAYVDLDALPHRGPQTFARLRSLSLRDCSGQSTSCFRMGEPIAAKIRLDVAAPVEEAEVGLKISSRHGTAIHYFCSNWEGVQGRFHRGTYELEVVVPQVLLYPGTYQIGLWVLAPGHASDDSVQEVTWIEVVKGEVTRVPAATEKYAFSGCEVYSPSRWRAERLSPGAPS